jgi:hypothetical protein
MPVCSYPRMSFKPPYFILIFVFNPLYIYYLANYGEYSGAPSLQETYDYARTIFRYVVLCSV